MTTPPDTDPPLLTLHAAVVLLGALLTGFVAGGLSYLGGVPVPLAVLAGLGAAGGAVPVLRTLIR
ncbi:hypothetical protein [Streptomyces sp. NBC_00091]|uniref:hypothetical protein n=1 Tax=Streptomyces sp. NBC_00091 TaxID=2975648 RepID=UPI00224DC816|nr:hypothetical protein [Streptomyces sp. NBC_00091]MCX5379856.1 hypothetical protein [Streptomyces sp. NBC_00091]